MSEFDSIKYQNEFNKLNYDRITIMVPKGKKAEYQAICKAKDITEESVQFLPGILKTATLGYDGKGQIRVKTVDELKAAFRESVDSPQHGGNSRLLGVVQKNNIAVARVFEKPIIDIFFVHIHPIARRGGP